MTLCDVDGRRLGPDVLLQEGGHALGEGAAGG